MPVEVSWLYPKRVIKIRHYGKITSEQLVASIAESVRLTEEGDKPVHTFLDSTGVEGKPEFSIGDLKHLVPRVIEGTGWTVAVQPRVVDRFFASLGMQLAGARYRFVNSQEEGMTFLLEQDPTLLDVIR
jgi:hypothetical protein